RGRPIQGTPDVGWVRPDGEDMDDTDWETGFARSVGLYLNGDAIGTKDSRGQFVTDDAFALLLNAHDEPIDWKLPTRWSRPWRLVIDTHQPARPFEGEQISDCLLVPERSLLLLEAAKPDCA